MNAPNTLSVRRATPLPFASAGRWLSKWFRRHQTLAELRGLDDHILKDVGITRLDIDMMRRHW